MKEGNSLFRVIRFFYTFSVTQKTLSGFTDFQTFRLSDYKPIFAKLCLIKKLE